MYGTIAAWRTYAAERGNDAPTAATDELATEALVRASDYIRTRYVLRLAGAYDGTEPEVEEATYIAAGQELSTPGFWAATYTPAQQKVLVEVKGIKWQRIEAKGNASDAALPVDPAIEALLTPLTAWGVPAVMTV
ncbi:hypothetical protein [Halovulum sp. GXIMD14793]